MENPKFQAGDVLMYWHEGKHHPRLCKVLDVIQDDIVTHKLKYRIRYSAEGLVIDRLAEEHELKPIGG